ncbi:MAG: response regulator [Acidobacteria bacterium]|nr:response regulator [Acidobacteriota bacterium]
MKILIVDDEPEILSIVAKWLSQKGHDAVTTSDAERALDLVESGDFNAVLLDLIMPHASGLNLISRIHELKPGLPVVVMSVIEDTRVAVLAAKEGIEGYVTKPIEFDKLDSILSRLHP